MKQKALGNEKHIHNFNKNMNKNLFCLKLIIPTADTVIENYEPRAFGAINIWQKNPVCFGKIYEKMKFVYKPFNECILYLWQENIFHNNCERRSLVNFVFT